MTPQSLCPHCGQPMPPETADRPYTLAAPKAVKVFVRTLEKPVRDVVVVRVVDFYREGA